MTWKLPQGAHRRAERTFPLSAEPNNDGDVGDPTFTPFCPFIVRRAAMFQRWENQSFLHWPYEIGEVQRLLPPGLVVESYRGFAWVGLVAFGVRTALPLVGRV